MVGCLRDVKRHVVGRYEIFCPRGEGNTGGQKRPRTGYDQHIVGLFLLAIRGANAANLAAPGVPKPLA